MWPRTNPIGQFSRAFRSISSPGYYTTVCVLYPLMAIRLRAFVWLLIALVLRFSFLVYNGSLVPLLQTPDTNTAINPMKLSQVCQAAHETVTRFSECTDDYEDGLLYRTQRLVQKSRYVLETALDQYTFDEIAVSYNGGKDCLVMLIIYLSVLHERYSSDELDKFNKINAVLINYEQQFPELVQFIESSTQEYALNLTQYNTQLKHGFEQYLHKHPQTKAIVVGTRHTDPYCSNLEDIQRTDSGWPDFVRVHPVVRWSYADIWCFLRTCQIPYCQLYDQGYTSLGGIDTTVKNPHLQDEQGVYKPAYLLQDGDAKERDGRIKR